MTPINKKATRIFEDIIIRMESDYLKIGKEGGAFMPLVVERIGEYEAGKVYSFAHYFKQNGDMCQDPEMTFLHHVSGKVYPMSFQMAIPPIYEESMFKDGSWKVRPALQRQHAAFAGKWLTNIKDQQGL